MAKIFISYSHKDNRFAKKLSLDLSQLGHNIWLDDWEICVGNDIAKKVQEGISKTDFVILILSPNSIESQWVGKEWQAAFSKEIEYSNVILLPVLKEKCEIPPLVKMKKIADFSTDYNEGFMQLSNALKTFNKDHNKKITNVWYLDDNEEDLRRFIERHSSHFAVTPFNNVIEILERLQGMKYGGSDFPDVLMVDLYAPLSKFEVNLKLQNETNKKLKNFFQMEKKLKKIVDSAWEPHGVEIVKFVRERYSDEELPIALYTQRGLVLLEDGLIKELESLGVSWLLKGQFSPATERLFLSKIIMYRTKGLKTGRRRVLMLDDNPKFLKEFVKRHKNYFDIECIMDQGDLLSTIEKMKFETRFPDVLLVDLYYLRGNDKESMLKIKEANEKLKEFHDFESELKELGACPRIETRR